MNTADAAPTIKELAGKTVLIGITRLSHKEELIEQRQYVGQFTSMDQLIHIKLKSGEDFTLPPDLSAFQRAKPGIYRLRSTGGEVENPDFTASWTVHAPAPKEKSRNKK
jgi:hypothetical protein